MRRTRVRVVAVIGALMLTLAACGGGAIDSGDTSLALPSLNGESAADDSSTTTTIAVDPEEALREYSECMRKHGVDMPDPGSSDGVIGLGVDGESGFEDFEAADAECSPLLEAAFGDFELSPEQQAEFMDEQLEFAQCMRDEGVDWPDPDPSSPGVISIELGDDVDPDTMNAAMDTCGQGLFGGQGDVTFGVGDESTP